MGISSGDEGNVDHFSLFFWHLFITVIVQNGIMDKKLGIFVVYWMMLQELLVNGGI